jgi:hypothetical protein
VLNGSMMLSVHGRYVIVECRVPKVQVKATNVIRAHCFDPPKIIDSFYSHRTLYPLVNTQKGAVPSKRRIRRSKRSLWWRPTVPRRPRRLSIPRALCVRAQRTWSTDRPRAPVRVLAGSKPLYADIVGPAVILNTRRGRLGGHEAYISFTGQDKRLDAWVPEKDVGAQVVDEPVAGPSTGAPLPLKSPGGSKRRKLAKVCWRFAERNAVLTRPAARCACASRPGYRDRARARCVPRAR